MNLYANAGAAGVPVTALGQVGASTWRLPYDSTVDRDRMFVATVDWLDAAVHRSPLDQYEMLLASGRVRMLLLDGSPLVDQVNRTRRFQLRFHIVRSGPGSIGGVLPTTWAMLDGLSPEHSPPGIFPVASVSRDAFLHELVMIHQGTEVTVADLIRHTANVVGGVHAGFARSEVDKKLDELAESISMGGMAPGVRCLFGISCVVVAALRPLRDSIAGGG